MGRSISIQKHHLDVILVIKRRQRQEDQSPNLNKVKYLLFMLRLDPDAQTGRTLEGLDRERDRDRDRDRGETRGRGSGLTRHDGDQGSDREVRTRRDKNHNTIKSKTSEMCQQTKRKAGLEA